MASEFYVGSTVRITAADLTHSDTGAVISGATVTVALYEADGSTLLDSDTATADGNDWSYDLPSPDDPGIYVVKVTADVGGVVWRDKVQLAYLPF
jgi:hypothetical protein